MHEHGLETTHENDTGHAAIEPATKIVKTSSGVSTLQAQNEQLKRTFEILAQGRPQVRDLAPPSEKQVVKDWDAQVQREIIQLAALFPEDHKIRKLGRHHWIYPEGFVPGRDNFTSTFYIMTGFHGAHVSGGVIALIAILGLFIVKKAGTSAIEVVGLYWHFVDLVWILLFTIVYLM